MLKYKDLNEARERISADVKKIRISSSQYHWKEDTARESLSVIAEAISSHADGKPFSEKFPDIREQYTNEFLYEISSGMFYRGSFFLNSFGSKVNRLRFDVGGTAMTFFEISQATPDEIVKACERAKSKVITELAYEHFVLKGDVVRAKGLFGHLIKFLGERAFELVVGSNNQKEYWPAMMFYSENKKNKINPMTINFYMKTIYASPNSMDRDLYSFVLKNFRSELKKNEFTNNFSDEDSKLMKDVSIFDLIESDANLRSKVLTLSDSKSHNYIRKMVEEDKARFERIVIKYLNDTHPKGKGKRKFIKTLNAMKRYVEVNVFALNKELQSYILLDIIQ
jgi:hypothetical protein